MPHPIIINLLKFTLFVTIDEMLLFIEGAIFGSKEMNEHIFLLLENILLKVLEGQSIFLRLIIKGNWIY